MTTLDGVERSLDAGDGAGLRPRTARPGSPGSWAARSPRSPPTTTRVLLEVANWNGTNILRTSRLLGLRSEASSRFEKQLHPDLCMRAQRVASRLLVELCGAKLVPGTIDVAADRPAPAPRDPAARRRGSSGLLGMEIAAGRPGRLPRAARLRGRARRRGPRGRRPARPPLRRHPRGRPDRGGRPRPRPRRAPADDAAGGRPRGRRAQPRAAAAAPGRGRACATSASTRSSAGASPTRARAPAADPRGDPRAEPDRPRQPALRGPVGDADDPARLAARRRRAQPRPRRRRASPCSSPAASTCRARRRSASGPLAGGFAGERPAPFAEPHRLGGARGRAAGAASPGAAAASRPTSSRSRACWRRSPGSSASSSRFAPAQRAVPASGARGRGRARRRRPVGWIGEIHPLVCREWDVEAAVGFEIDLGGAGRLPPASARRPTRTSPPSRPSTRTSPSSSPADVPATAVRDAVLDGGGELLRSADGLRPLRGRAGRARAARAWRCGSSSAPPTAPSPTTRSPACAAAIETELERDRRGAAWLSRAHSRSTASPRRGSWSPAPPASPAPSRPRSSGATRGCELVAVTSRSDAGTRLDQPLPALPGAARADRARPRPGSRTSTPRSSPTRTAPRRRPSPRCAGSASSSSTSPPTSGCATCRPTSAGTASTAPPELLGDAVYGLTELYRDAAARGGAGRHPRLLPDRERPRPGAAGRAGPARRRRRRRDAGHLRATAAAATTPSTSRR